MEQVYSSQLQLAQYFEETQDLWLSDRFYQACLKTAKSLGNHSQQKEGEANANIGLAYEARGEFDVIEATYNKTSKYIQITFVVPT